MRIKSAAVLTVKEPSRMTPTGRKHIANWLRHCARNLVKHGSKLSKQFRARYLYLEQ